MAHFRWADINGLDIEGLDGTPTRMRLNVRKPYITKMPPMPGRMDLIPKFGGAGRSNLLPYVGMQGA